MSPVDRILLSFLEAKKEVLADVYRSDHGLFKTPMSTKQLNQYLPGGWIVPVGEIVK